MSLFETISGGFLEACSTVSSTISAIVDTLNFVIRINYDIVSTVYFYLSVIISTIIYILKGLSTIIATVLTYAQEFVIEVLGCVCAFFVLLWRILVLFYKIICLLFTGIETLVVVLWTGSYVTVKTLKQSITDIYEYCGSTWNLANETVKDLVDSFFIFFASIGNAALTAVCDSCSAGMHGLRLSYSGMANVFHSIESSIMQVIKNIIHFYTSYLPSLGKETYLGIFICCLLYFACYKLVCFLNQNGMTLFTRHRPTISYFRTAPQLDSEDDLSDNEGVSITDEGDGSEGSVDDDDESDVMSEHTVEDNDDDDSELSLNSQTFSSSDDDEDDIEVELPPVNERYGLRNRSATPKRHKVLSPEDFEREIEKEKDKRKCVVCQDSAKSVLILPCRHMCLCVGCANQIVRARYVERRVCPLCRQRIQKVMNVYT